MFDPHLFLFNLSLCAAALVVAAFMDEGAVPLAGLLTVNFLFCALAYTPYAPKLALAAVGVTVTSKDLWMLADAIFGALALTGFHRWWGWALWAFACVQVGLHIAFKLDAFSDTTYTDGLQMALHAQLAVFFVAGGPGAVNFVRRAIGRLRGRRVHRASALATEAE